MQVRVVGADACVHRLTANKEYVGRLWMQDWAKRCAPWLVPTALDVRRRSGKLGVTQQQMSM